MPDPTWVFPDGTSDQIVTDSDGLGLGTNVPVRRYAAPMDTQ
jgi:hypothetical protein